MAFGGNLNQFFGNVADFFLNSGFFGLPGNASQGIQLNVIIFNSIAGNNINIFDRNKQFGIIGIKNFQTIVRRTAGSNVFQSHKAADTVLDMNDQFSDAERRYVCNEILGRHFFGMFTVLTFTQNILL